MNPGPILPVERDLAIPLRQQLRLCVEPALASGCRAPCHPPYWNASVAPIWVAER
jgi:hypothetical protein